MRSSAAKTPGGSPEDFDDVMVLHYAVYCPHSEYLAGSALDVDSWKINIELLVANFLFQVASTAKHVVRSAASNFLDSNRLCSPQLFNSSVSFSTGGQLQRDSHDEVLSLQGGNHFIRIFCGKLPGLELTSRHRKRNRCI